MVDEKEIIKNVAIFSITPPDDHKGEEWNAWLKTRSKIGDILKTLSADTILCETVFLLQLPRDLQALSGLISLLQLPKVSHKVLYFSGEPQWTFES